ncbi:SDR family oxidoreductase [Nocardioides pocheonensis]|uniref:NAD(P)-binding domain-containing protein n=1 Tax=Nocardioides pocheonensis TaxID=661485 RepID=A0A3N0GLY2_9ACTN|nr:NAD(P)H-binding protein [Nocardioides pocheonensis]RNM13080.1 hypothetical protein EFL26_16785 [Nocardioides pocheonensis]
MRIAIAGATGQVGSPLAEAAARTGHDVVRLARSTGVDLTAPVDPALLAGADVVVDVTRTALREEEASAAFFTAVATNLGEAARSAGVSRTVLLSIIGVDRIGRAPREPAGRGPEDHYRAKWAHEQATREHAPGVRIVRAAQFHDLARVLLLALREGDTSRVAEMPVQPVALEVVVDTLLDVATGTVDEPVVEVAGPRVERFCDLAAAFATRDVPGLHVEPAPVSAVLAGGALLPGPDAVLGGPDFQTWFRHSNVASSP